VSAGTADDRAAVIAGLRDLADFLEANPAVPGPSGSQRHLLCAPFGPDDERRAFVDHVAAVLGTSAAFDSNGHYEAVRSFGPVDFVVFMIPDAAHARYEAENSYRDSIRLDDEAVAA
jgi:hypothetical protein